MQKLSSDKEASWKSETTGTVLNPLNWLLTPLTTHLGALSGYTEMETEEEDRKKELWKKLLIPGRAPYNLGKSFAKKKLKGSDKYKKRLEEKGVSKKRNTK